MASNDFIIKIVLDAQSKIAPVMATAVAQAKTLESAFNKTDKAAKDLGGRMDLLTGHVEKARSTMQGMNRTLPALAGHLDKMRENLVGVNRNLRTLQTQTDKASTAMAGLVGVVEGLQKKLAALDRKMTEMGAKTYSPKVKVDGTENADAVIDRLQIKLLRLERSKTKVRIDVERERLDREIAEVEAQLKKVTGGTERHVRIKIGLDKESEEQYEKDFQKLYDAEYKHQRNMEILHARGIAENDRREQAGLAAQERHLAQLESSIKASQDRVTRMRREAQLQVERDDARHASQQQRNLAKAGDRLLRADSNTRDDNRPVRGVDVDRAELAQARAAIQAELAARGLNFQVGVKLSPADRAQVEAQLLRLGLKRVHIKVLLDEDRARWQQQGARAGALFQNGFNRASSGSGGGGSGNFLTSSGLRTAAIRLAFLFSEPLLSALTAVAGELISVGAAAGVAAAGLGGLAVAGVAQAVPALGLIGLAVSRVGAVLKASQLASAEHDKGNKQGAVIDNQRANAQDALASAHQGVKNSLYGLAQANQGVVDAELAVRDAQAGVVDAQKSVVDSQVALNDARREGIRTLQDMALQERQANLSAQQSKIALALRVASGGGGLVQEAQLRAESDSLSASRATTDNRAAQAGGIEGLPAVQSARDGVAQAEKGVVQAQKGVATAVRGVQNAKHAVAQAAEGVASAQRQVASAQRGLDQASEKMGAAASAYALALAKLSAGERVLLRSIENFKELFKKGSALRDISDIIVESFARGLDKVAALLNDSSILAGFAGLAGGIGKAFDDLATFLTTGKMRTALRFFSDEGSKNIGVVEKILENLITIFTNVATAASAAFGTALRDGESSLGRIARLTSTPAWQHGASKFFTNALDSIKAFLHLGGAIIGLFAAIAGPGGGADEGTNSIERLTRTIRGATKYVQENGDKVQAFLHDAANATSDVLRVFVGIAAALVKTFDADSVKGFADFLIKTVIPILAGFVHVLGILDRAIFAVFNSAIVSEAAKFAAPFLLVMAAIKKVTSVLGDMIIFFTNSRVAMAIFRTGAVLLRAALSALAAGNPFAWAVLAAIALYELYQHVKIFRDTVDSVINFIKSHWKTLAGVLLVTFTGPIGAIALLLLKFGPKIIKAFTGPFNAVKDFVSGIAGTIFSPLKGAFDSLKGWAQDAFGYIGKKLKDIGGFLGIGGESGFDKAIKEAQRLRKEADAAAEASKQAGTAAVAAASYSALGRTAAANRAAASFGNLKPGDLGQPSKQSKKRDAEFDYFATADAKITPEEAKAIKKLWQDLVGSTDQSTKRISTIVRQMREAIEKTLDRLTRVSKSDFHDIWESGRKNFDKLDTSIAHSMGNIKTTIVDTMADIADAFYQGFKYIVGTTNESLKAFDATPAKLTIQAPRVEKHADGGWIGNMGERGQDAIHTVLGRGEAVLNATQQKVVEPALNAMYGFGLGDMFKRTRGYHAGGAEQEGYAQGGLTGPFGSGAAFTPLANFAKSKFGLNMTSGRTNHGFNTASGNVSDHSWGGAGDFSNGVLTAQEDAFNAFFKTKLPEVVKQLIWRNKDQFRGFPVSGHEDHVHLAVKRELAFDASRMARLLSGASKGLDISALLAGITDGGVNADHVEQPKVKGGTNLKNLAGGILKRVTAAANKFIDKAASQMNVSTDPGGGQDTAGGQYDKTDLKALWKRNGGNSASANIAAAIALAESGGNPNAQNSIGATGLWQILRSAHPDWDRGGNLKDPNWNAKAAVAISSNGRNWNPWTVFTGADTPGHEKTYLKYLASGGQVGCAHCGGNHATHAHGGFAGMQWGGMQAHGGDYVVNKPTMFVAGEKGTELASFKPLRAAKGKPGAYSPDFSPTGTVSDGDVSALFKQLVSGPKKVKDRSGAIVALLDEFTEKQLRTLRRSLNDAIRGSKKGSFREALTDLKEKLSKYLNDPLTILAAEIQRFQGFANVAGIREIMDRVGDSLEKITRQVNILKRSKTEKGAKKLEDSLTKMGKALDFLAGDSGPLALFEQQITNRTARAARNLIQRRFSVGANGAIRRSGISDDEVATQEIADLKDTRRGLIGERGSVNQLLTRARAGLKLAKTDEQRKLFRGTISTLTSKREGIADQIAANTQSIVERREAQQGARVEDINTRFDAARGIGQAGPVIGPGGRLTRGFRYGVEGLRRINNALGRGPESNLSLFDTQKDLAKGQIDELRKQLKSASTTGNTKLAQQIEAQIAELDISILEITQAKITATIDAINSSSEKAVAGVERNSKIGEILGTGSTVTKNNSLIGIYSNQIAQLEAVDTGGNEELASATKAKIQELRNAVVELTAGNLQAGIDDVNKAADQREATLGLRGRMADLKGRMGDALGSLQDKGLIAQDQLSSTTQRRDGLRGQLAQALADGNVGVATTLTATIAELDTTIAEQTQTLKENTFQVRKLSIDIINGATGRTTGILGSVQSIRNNISAAAGTSNTAGTLSVLQSVGAALTNASTALIAQARGSISKSEFSPQGTQILSQLVAAFEQGPAAFAATLQSLAPVIAAFEGTLAGPALEAFQGIVDGLVGNTVAVTENTTAIASLKGTVAQTFSSTAWTTFRQAIFDGSGGLLPQYNIPQMATGGMIMSTGLIHGHSGEMVIPAAEVDRTAKMTSGETNHYYFETPMEIADPGQIAAAISFRRSVGRAS